MRKNAILSIGVLVLILAAAIHASSLKSVIRFQVVKNQESERPEFRYIILESSVNREDPKVPIRIVSILLDEKAFSEETLKKLYALVSNRFPKPEYMKVWVYTSLDQVATPEEEGDPVGSHITKEDGNSEKHYKAFLLRQNGNELFRYRNLEGTDSKTIVIKGKDPLKG